MINKWIRKVLATVPFVGNVVLLTYMPKSWTRKSVTTNFLAIRDERGLVRGLVMPTSVLKNAIARAAKYNHPPLISEDLGCMVHNILIQQSTKDYKKPMMRGFKVCSIRADGDEMLLLLTGSELDAANKRFFHLFEVLNFKLTITQRIALFISQWIFGEEYTVFDKRKVLIP